MAEKVMVLNVSAGQMEGRDYAFAWVHETNWEDRALPNASRGPIPFKVRCDGTAVFQALRDAPLPCMCEVEMSVTRQSGPSGPVAGVRLTSARVAAVSAPVSVPSSGAAPRVNVA